MALLTPTAASLAVVSGSVKDGTSGAALSQGDYLYKDSADSNKLKKADSSTAAEAAIEGIALQTVAAADQRIEYLKWEAGAAFQPGPTLTAGTIYWLSTTAGQSQDTAPATGEFVSFAGIATSTTTITHTSNSGVAAP